jgi:capsular polysaccharide biosynthesis protein
MQSEMEREQQGEQIKLLESANLPLAPSFPVRWMFAAGGLVAGLGLGVSLVMIRELLDRSIRHEGDVAELLNLPTLAFVPWAIGPPESPDMRDSWRNRLRPAPAK